MRGDCLPRPHPSRPQTPYLSLRNHQNPTLLTSIILKITQTEWSTSVPGAVATGCNSISESLNDPITQSPPITQFSARGSADKSGQPLLTQQDSMPVFYPGLHFLARLRPMTHE